MEDGFAQLEPASLIDGAPRHGWTVNRCFTSADGTPQAGSKSLEFCRALSLGTSKAMS
jgi:hypothetical protein